VINSQEQAADSAKTEISWGEEWKGTNSPSAGSRENPRRRRGRKEVRGGGVAMWKSRRGMEAIPSEKAGKYLGVTESREGRRALGGKGLSNRGRANS